MTLSTETMYIRSCVKKLEVFSLYVMLDYIAIEACGSILGSSSPGPLGTQQRLSGFDPSAVVLALVT